MHTDRLTHYIISKSENIKNTFPESVLFIAGDSNKMHLVDVEFSCCVEVLPSPATRGDAVLDIVNTNRPNVMML